jgi:hypothetical protein
MAKAFLTSEVSVPSKTSVFKFRWDVLLFFGFVFTTVPDATGVALHEWVSLALIFVIVVHLTLNWNWVVGTTRQMFRRLPNETRFNHTLNFLLFLFMALTMVSGVVTSRRALHAMGIALGQPDYFWTHLHGIFAYTTVAFVAVHLIAHLRWIFVQLKHRRSGTTSKESERGVGFMIFVRRAIIVVLVSLAMAFAVLQLDRTSWAERVREGNRRYLQEHPIPSPKVK